MQGLASVTMPRKVVTVRDRDQGSISDRIASGKADQIVPNGHHLVSFHLTSKLERNKSSSRRTHSGMSGSGFNSRNELRLVDSTFCVVSSTNFKTGLKHHPRWPKRWPLKKSSVAHQIRSGQDRIQVGCCHVF